MPTKTATSAYRLVRTEDHSFHAYNDNQTRLTSAREAYEWMLPIVKKEPVENMWIIPLGHRLEIIGDAPIFITRGTNQTVAAPPSEVFRALLATDGASAFVVIHNHPNGDVKASKDDIAFSKNLYKLADMMGMPMTDSIIMTPTNGFTSLAEDGLLHDDPFKTLMTLLEGKAKALGYKDEDDAESDESEGDENTEDDPKGLEFDQAIDKVDSI